MVEPRKRERKTVEFFVPGTAKETSKTIVPEGKGTKLSAIPNVCYKLDKLKGTDEQLEQLHTILFKTKGKALSRKKDVKSFSGLVYEGDDEEEANKAEARVNKLTLAQLHALMDILDVSRGTDSKEKKAERVVKFLEKPEVLTEKDLKAQAETKKTKAAEKKAKDNAKKEKEAAKKAKAAAKASKGSSAKKAKTTPGVEKKATKVASGKKAATKTDTPAKTKKTAAKPSAAKEPPSTGKKRKAAEVEEKPTAKKAKKSKAAPKADTWPGEEQLMKDIEGIVEDITGGDGYIKLGAVYNALGSKYGLSKEEVMPKRAQIKGLLARFQEPQDEEIDQKSKTDAEEDKMEIDEPTAEEAPSAAPEEVIESTDKPDSPEKPSSLDKSAPAEPPAEATITATEVTPDLEEPIVKDTVVKEPAVKEPSEPVALPAEKTTEEIVPVPEIQATEVEPSEQAPASNAVPKVEEPPSATTSQQAQGIPVPDASAPNGVSKPDVSSVVSSESKGEAAGQSKEPALPEPLIATPATTEGDEIKEAKPDPSLTTNPVQPRGPSEGVSQPASQEAQFDPDSLFNFSAGDL